MPLAAVCRCEPPLELERGVCHRCGKPTKRVGLSGERLALVVAEAALGRRAVFHNGRTWKVER